MVRSAAAVAATAAVVDVAASASAGSRWFPNPIEHFQVIRWMRTLHKQIPIEDNDRLLLADKSTMNLIPFELHRIRFTSLSPSPFYCLTSTRIHNEAKQKVCAPNSFRSASILIVSNSSISSQIVPHESAITSSTLNQYPNPKLFFFFFPKQDQRIRGKKPPRKRTRVRQRRKVARKKKVVEK